MSAPAEDIDSKGSEENKKKKEKRIIAPRSEKHPLIKEMEELVSKALKLELFLGEDYKAKLIEDLLRAPVKRQKLKGFQDVLANIFEVNSAETNLDEFAETNTNTAVYERAIELKDKFNAEERLAYYSILYTDFTNLYRDVKRFNYDHKYKDVFEKKVKESAHAHEPSFDTGSGATVEPDKKSKPMHIGSWMEQAKEDVTDEQVKTRIVKSTSRQEKLQKQKELAKAELEALKEKKQEEPKKEKPKPASEPKELTKEKKKEIYTTYSDFINRQVSEIFEELLDIYYLDYIADKFVYQGPYSDKSIGYISEYIADDLEDKIEQGKNMPVLAKLKRLKTDGFGSFGLSFAIAAMEIKFLALLKHPLYIGKDGYKDHELKRDTARLVDYKNKLVIDEYVYGVELKKEAVKLLKDGDRLGDLLERVGGGYGRSAKIDKKVIKNVISQSFMQGTYLTETKYDFFKYLDRDDLKLGPEAYKISKSNELDKGKIVTRKYWTWFADEFPTKIKDFKGQNVPQKYIKLCESFGLNRAIYEREMENFVGEKPIYEAWLLYITIEKIFELYRQMRKEGRE